VVETQPSFSRWQNALFIRAVRQKTTIVNSDIYVTHIDDSSRWSDPVPVSENINTPGNENRSSFIPIDQTLYFFPMGSRMGGLTFICVEKRWFLGRASHLGYPIIRRMMKTVYWSALGDVPFCLDPRGWKSGLDCISLISSCGGPESLLNERKF